MEHPALMSRLRVWIFYEKWYSDSPHDGVAYTRPPWRGSADADILSAFPLSFNTFQENINTLQQISQHDIPSTVGVLFVLKLLFLAKKIQKTMDWDALEVTVFVKRELQAIFIQNTLI